MAVKPGLVFLAFDADARSNSNVARHHNDLYQALPTAGYEVTIETWLVDLPWAVLG